MAGPIFSPFSDPETHSVSRDIIRRHSSNKSDVRATALEGIGLESVKAILDLGCGFGFMAEKIVEITAPGVRITGIDACPENEEAFLSVFQRAGREAEFLLYEISTSLPFDAERFDLVISSYSLYFFPGIIPDVARIMKKDGVFVVITHSRTSFTGLYEAMGIRRRDSEIPRLLRAFSAENGEEKLSRSFREIERIDFPNTLSFNEKDFNDLMLYAGFKLPLLLRESERCDLLPDKYKKKLLFSLSDKKEILIDKNDAVFRCRRPLCH